MKRKDLRLLLSIGSSRNLFIAAIIAAFVWSAVLVLNGFFIATIIVGLIERQALDGEKFLALGLLWIFRSLFQSQFERWCSNQAVQVKRELRKRLIAGTGTYSASPAELSNLAIKGLNSLDIYVGRFLPQMIFATITPLVVIASIFLLDPTSAFIAIFTLPLIPLFGALIGKYTSDAVMKKWRELGILARYFEDSMRGFVTLKLFGRHRSQPERILTIGKRYSDETMKVLRVSFLSSLVLELCATISVALIAVSIGIRLVNGTIDFSPSLMVLILAPEVYFPLRNAAALFHASADGAQAMESLTSLTAPTTSHKIRELAWPRWTSPFLGIAIPENALAKGEAKVLKGESGLGKTTFALYLLNSIEIDKVAWIPQNPAMAQGTVRHQFHLVNPALSDDEIVKLCSKVNLDVAELPKGLDTHVGGAAEKSSQASGGQIRKLAIARAFAKNSEILIADEPTADLDSTSAKVVNQQLRHYVSAGGTLLLITHDELFDDLPRIEVEYLER